MKINWTMIISLTIVVIFAVLVFSIAIEDYQGGVVVEEKCAVPWSAQTHRDSICTRTIYCNGINKIFYWDACKKHDVSLGQDANCVLDEKQKWIKENV